MNEKHELRGVLRAARKAHVAGLAAATRALVLMRPPAVLVRAIPEGACVGLYHAVGAEAPARGYAKWFVENGRRVALPWFAGREAAMVFREWRDPWGDDGLEPGAFGVPQPDSSAEVVVPDWLIVPLVGFTATGDRLGQGAGHYDRWLAAHPDARAVGLAWDCQLCESLPMEPHDRPLLAVVTPTRLYGDLS
ncbi:MAG: 5-formyltetrahydrofolate cyclo-ligase [Sphingomonadales bacterium]|nr:5-formyltetrahydrofolate cyclo-ligase [Sphingomonadales bacterium]